ncbi:MAG: hypothetical protein NVSMB1_06010 [Polyangiales bacterium]
MQKLNHVSRGRRILRFRGPGEQCAYPVIMILGARRSLSLLVQGVILSVFFTCGCSTRAPDLSEVEARVLPKGVGLLIAEADQGVGAVESFDASTHARTTNFGTRFDPDPHLRRLIDPRTHAERIFQVQSLKERLVELDRRGHIVASFNVADDAMTRGHADPLDVAIASDGALWVTRYLSRSLAVLESDGTRRCEVDLSTFDDFHGLPGMSAIAIVGDFAYVALRRLGGPLGIDPINVSVIAVIDTHARCGDASAVKHFVDLPAPNPWDRFLVRGGGDAPELIINCIAGPLSKPVPIRGASLVKVDIAQKRASTVLSDVESGGFINGFDLESDDDHVGYAIVASYEAPNATSLIRFDPITHRRDPSFRATSTAKYSLWGVSYANGVLFIADRREERPGIRVLSASDGAQLELIPTRLLPVEILVLRDPTP